MIKKLSFTLCFLWSLSVYCQSKLQSLDSLFIRLESTAPGVAVAIVQDGEVIYNKAFGMANLEYGIPLTTDAVFDIASLAKQFTGYSIAKLELEEQLDINDPVSKYLPELTALVKDITVGQLIHHSSGLRDIGELFDIGHFGSELTLEKTMEIMTMQRELNFPPNTESDYSNTNYVLLAKIVERVTGLVFNDWCQKYIFEPLEMRQSFANDNPKVIIPNRAVAYYQQDTGYSFDQNNGMALIGSSAVYSTSTDLAKWLKALVSNPSFVEVFTKMQSEGTLLDGKSIGYGYGVAMESYQGKKMVVHSGSTPAGFRTSMAIAPDDKSAIILLSNLGNIDLFKTYQFPILEILYGPPADQSAPAMEASSDIVANASLQLTDDQLDRFVGTYLFNQDMKVQIRKVDNGLTVQPEGAPQMPLNPLSIVKLDFPDFKSTLIFSEEQNGRYQRAVIMSQGEQAGRLKRVTLTNSEDLDLSPYVGKYYSQELNLLWTIDNRLDKLSIIDTKRGQMDFMALSEGLFRDEMGQVIKIEFLSNAQGAIEGFKLHRGSRLRGLSFQKLN